MKLYAKKDGKDVFSKNGLNIWIYANNGTNFVRLTCVQSLQVRTWVGLGRRKRYTVFYIWQNKNDSGFDVVDTGRQLVSLGFQFHQEHQETRDVWRGIADRQIGPKGNSGLLNMPRRNNLNIVY